MKQHKTYTSDRGFTLMEIIVATAIFAVVVSSILALFNYTLKISRRGEALRQATQGMRDFVEAVVKEVRNGQIDYGLINGGQGSSNPNNNRSSLFACPGVPAALNASSTDNTAFFVGDTYAAVDNRLGIITSGGDEECFYYGDDSGSGAYVDGSNPPTTFVAPPGHSYTLVFKKNNLPGQVLNPPNFRIDNLAFLVRPVCDPYAPYCTSYNNDFAKMQPSVTIAIKFVVQLPTGEQLPIYYQTTVSSRDYKVPNQ